VHRDLKVIADAANNKRAGPAGISQRLPDNICRNTV
jgi:hypothetical protein